MNAQFQTIAALVVVVIATALLVLRSVRKKRNGGCGGDCGCPTSDLKARGKSVASVD
jgi:hypothetical protein